MDLDQNSVRWARTYDVLGIDSTSTIRSKYVNALSINPDGDKVAVHVSEDNPAKGTLTSMLFVIRAADGGHETKKAMHITHDTQSKFLLRSSQSLFYTGDDTILMALTIDYDSTLMNCDCDMSCDSRMRLAKFNVQNENFDYYLEQDKFFGQSTSLAYGHFGSNSDKNIYIGGAGDDNRFAYHGHRTDWGPAIYQLQTDGGKKELYKLKIGNSWQTNGNDHAVIDHIHLDKGDKYLYGTTKKHIGPGTDYQNQGNMIYFWRVELKSDYLIDDSKTPIVKKLEIGANSLSSYCYVTGIEQNLRNSDQNFDIILTNRDLAGNDNHELWYIRFSTNANSHASLKLYNPSNIEITQSFLFLDPDTESQGGFNNVRRSYSVGKALTWINGYEMMAPNSMGMLMPSLWSESCLDTDESVLTSLQTTTISNTQLIKNNEEEFTTSMRANPTFSKKDYQIYDIKYSEIFSSSWCSTFDGTFDPATITPGYITSGLGHCNLAFDNNEFQIPFTMPSLTPTCTDDQSIWTAWIEPLDALNPATYDSSRFKVAIDTETSNINVMGHQGYSHNNQMLNFRAHFDLPDGSSTNFDFVVGNTGSGCESPTLTPPAGIVDMTYNMGDGTGQQVIFPFTPSPAGCTNIAYSTVIEPQFALVPSLSGFINPMPSGRGASWYTADTQYEGSYLVTITAQSGCSSSSATFTLTVGQVNLCDTDTFTFVGTKFATPAHTYPIRAPLEQFVWDDTAVTTGQTAATCGTLKWEITLTDGSSPIDSTIFTWSAAAGNYIDIYNTDISKALSYLMRVKVSWDGYAASKVLDFTIKLEDQCDTSMVVTPSALSNPNLYLIGASQVDINYGAFSISPSYCVVTYHETVSPTLPDTSAITFDHSSSQVSIYSVDRPTGRTNLNAFPVTYSVTIYVKSEATNSRNGAAEQLTFNVQMKDPCMDAIIDMSNNVIPTISDYTVGQTQAQHNFDYSQVTDGMLAGLCPTIEYELKNSDGTPISASVFTFSGSPKSLKIYSLDPLKAQNYNLRLYAKYGEAVYTTEHSSAVITLKVLNPCPSATLSHGIDPFSSTSFVQGATPITVNYDQTIATSSTDPVDCGKYVVEPYTQNPADGNYYKSNDITPGSFIIVQEAQTITYPSVTIAAGVYQQKYKVFLKDYPTVQTAALSTVAKQLTITEPPCDDPVVTATPQSTLPNNYRYTGSTFSMPLAPFTVNPPNCIPTYSCSSVGPGGAAYSICPIAGISNTLTTSSWDSSNGAWTFSTTDVKTAQGGTYEPGVYTLTIVGTAGTSMNKFDSVAMQLTLIDPCPTNLNLVLTTLFTDMNYKLRDPEPTPHSWNLSDIASLSTNAQCGPITYSFFLIDSSSGSPVYKNFASLTPGSNPFKVDDPTPRTFRLPYTEDTSFAGTYTVAYAIGLSNYPSLELISALSFTVTIVDPCESPSSLTASTLPHTALDYTITQPSISFLVTPFIVDPAWCALTYTSAHLDQATMTWSFDSNVITPTMKVLPYSQDLTIDIQGTTTDIASTLTDKASFTLTLKNPCVDPAYNWINAPADNTEHYEIRAASQEIDYKSGYSVQLATLCGSYTQTISEGLSTEITFDPIKFELRVQTDNFLTAETSQEVTVTTQLDEYPSVKHETKIQVKFTACKVPTDSVAYPEISSQTYQIGDEAIELTFADFKSAEALACGYSWSYSAKIKDEASVAVDMAPYMSFDAAAKKIQIYSTSGKAQKLFVELIGAIDNGQEFSYSFEVIYKEVAPPVANSTTVYATSDNLAPQFIEPLQTLTVFDMSSQQAKDQVSYQSRQKIGKLLDLEGDDLEVIFINQDIVESGFLIPGYDEDGNIYVDLIKNEETSAGIKDGDYTLEFEVVETKDGETKIQRYSFVVTVSGMTQKEEDEAQTQVNTTIEIKQEESEKVDLREVNVTQPTLEISKIDKFGVVEIKFSEKLLVPSNWQLLNDTHIDVGLAAYNEETQVLMGFEWSVKSFASDRMLIQFEFEYPQQISTDIDGKDVLSVKIQNPNKFISSQYRIPIANQTLTTIKVPVQARLENKVKIEQLETEASKASQGMSTVMGTNFAMNIILASSLSLVWGLINSMQLVTHFPFLNYRWPYSSGIIFGELYELATLDLIPTDYAEEIIVEKVGQNDKSESNFDADEHLSDSTIEAGYDSSNVIISSIFQTAMVVVAIIAGMLLLVLRCCFNRVASIKQFFQKLWRSLFWNFFIRMLLESYLELAMNNWIRILVRDNSTWWESASTYFAFTLLSFMTLAGLLTPLFIHCKKSQLKTESFISKYGALTDQLRVEMPSTKYYQMFFMLRRLTFAMIVIFMPKTPWAQVQLVCFQCSLHLIYAGVRPFYLPYRNRLEMTNEFLVLLSSYFMFIYSDAFLMVEVKGVMIKEDERQEQVGWVQVGLLGLQIAINLTLMLVLQIYGTYRAIKLRCLKRTHAKKMKEIEARKKFKQALRKDLSQGNTNQSSNQLLQASSPQIVSKTRMKLSQAPESRIQQQRLNQDLECIQEMPSPRENDVNAAQKGGIQLRQAQHDQDDQLVSLSDDEQPNNPPLRQPLRIRSNVGHQLARQNIQATQARNTVPQMTSNFDQTKKTLTPQLSLTPNYYQNSLILPPQNQTAQHTPSVFRSRMAMADMELVKPDSPKTAMQDKHLADLQLAYDRLLETVNASRKTNNQTLGGKTKLFIDR